MRNVMQDWWDLNTLVKNHRINDVMCPNYYKPGGALREMLSQNAQKLSERGIVYLGRRTEIRGIEKLIEACSKESAAKEAMEILRRKREDLRKSIARYDVVAVLCANTTKIDAVLPIAYGPTDKIGPLCSALYEHFATTFKHFGVPEPYNADNFMGLHLTVADDNVLKVVERLWKSPRKLEEFNTGIRLHLSLDAKYVGDLDNLGQTNENRKGSTPSAKRARRGTNTLKVLEYLASRRDEIATPKQIAGATGLSLPLVHSTRNYCIKQGFLERRNGRLVITDIGTIKIEDLQKSLYTIKNQ